MLNTASCPSGFRCISSCSLRAVSVVPSARRGCLHLLSCLDDPLVLHDFLVEVDLWDFRDPFFKLQLFLPLLPLLDICIGSWMLRDWPADCSFSSVMYFPSYISLSRSQSFGLLILLLALLFSCLLLALTENTYTKEIEIEMEKKWKRMDQKLQIIKNEKLIFNKNIETERNKKTSSRPELQYLN